MDGAASSGKILQILSKFEGGKRHHISSAIDAWSYIPLG